MSKTPLIGIDLGTNKFCVGVFQNDKIEIIPNDIGERITPSYIAFTDKENLVGDTTKNQMHRNASNTLFSIKRLIGRKFEDNDIQNMIKYYPFKIIKDEHSERIKIEININNEKKQFFVEEIWEMEMLKIKEEANKYFGKEIKDIIIGVPNSFNFMQRKIIKEAASKCGLNCIRVVGESNLSSLSHAFNQQIDKMEENILIFDFGAGFLNVSVTSNEDGLIEVKSVNGLSNLGGEDFDNKLIEYCLNEFKSKKGVDRMNIMNNPRALRRLRTECEKAKKILSSATKTIIEIFDLMDGEDLIIEITRDIFEDLCIDLFKKCLIPIENVLKDAKMNKSQIDTIILTGGSSRIHKIQSMIKEYFNGFDDIIQLNSDEVVSSGAAIQAAIISNIPHFKFENFIFLDVIPYSIGFETTGGVMTVIVPRNSTVPCKKSQIFSVYEDNQTAILIKVYEGEKYLTKDNLLIDKMLFDGLPPGPRGQIGVEITLEIDANFNLRLYAVEKTTGKKMKKEIYFARANITINFLSIDQQIKFDTICFNSDFFSTVEKKLFDEFPILTTQNVFYISNGNVIDKSLSIKQNKIKDGTTILINVIE